MCEITTTSGMGEGRTRKVVYTDCYGRFFQGTVFFFFSVVLQYIVVVVSIIFIWFYVRGWDILVLYVSRRVGCLEFLPSWYGFPPSLLLLTSLVSVCSRRHNLKAKRDSLQNRVFCSN